MEMRRQYQRPVRNQVQYVTQNAATRSGTNTYGYVMRERPADIKREVENERRRLQIKYDREAAEAEEKRKMREKKKREEWLKRQEALVRPGFRLGSENPKPNLRRDLVEHQEIAEVPTEKGSPNQKVVSEHLKLLIQQGKERETEAERLKRDVGEPTSNIKSSFVKVTRGQNGYFGNSQEMVGQVLGSKSDTGNAQVPTSSRNQDDEEIDDRMKMRLARLRMQEQYNAELKKTEESKSQVSP